MMATAKRKQSDAGFVDNEHTARRASNVLGYNAHTPWLHEGSRFSATRRFIGAEQPKFGRPLANMVSTVQDLLDPDFDPLIAILDEEPRFLKPLPSRIPPEDLEFLRFRGALSIPESGLRTELLRCYIKWVHSFLPVLNLQEFLRCIAENDPDGNISLLLFQAVMFVATAFVGLSHLQSAGFTTRKAARNTFYTRLRLLHSLECEDDRIVIVQTLLLMTYWSDHMNCPQRDIWDWIGICSINAQSIGLNRDPSSTKNMDIRTKRLRARLWWCLFSRDRLIAMGMRRPTQVNEGSSNLPMLRIDDFDFEPFHPAVIELFHCRQLEDVSHQKRLATMFIEKAKLCQCIGRVLFAQYTPSQYQFGLTNKTTINLVPRHASESELARCSQRLDSWLSALPKDAQFIPASGTSFNDGEDVLLLHGAMIRMLYHATISALHRPWAKDCQARSGKSRAELANVARRKMQEAATGITHIIQGLNQLNLTRYLPQSGVTVILPAAVAHLANSMSNDPALRQSSISNFQRCFQVLKGLKEIYPAADMEVSNIEAAIKAMTQTQNAEPPPPNITEHTSRNIHSPLQGAVHSHSPLQADIPNHWTPPSEDQDPSTLQNNDRVVTTESSSHHHHPDQPTPPGDFIFDSITPSSSTAPPFVFTDLLDIDVDVYTSNFTPPPPPAAPNNPNNGPDLDLDWTSELLRWADANPEYYYPTTAGTNEPRGHLFSFPADRSPPASHRGNHPNNGGITGDLDRDLGFISGDDMF
ncbi:fungal-specific transcription factor domain-containing protein [Aspergillus pseudoustus]|uniref:Fungal-specific transcription factor domain-containing protein n=1 Tax=Aspergillus pseudoustus TaxID=1810923 RepID=A0ABR4IWT9_9EURO